MFASVFHKFHDLNTVKNNHKMRNHKRKERDFKIIFNALIETIFSLFRILLVKIKQFIVEINHKFKVFYNKLEECYEINFIAGEEDAKLRERLRKKFNYSFSEIEKEFEPHENELLDNTFENTVYNALYTSEVKQSQLKKMKFAPRVLAEKSDKRGNIQKKEKDLAKIVSFCMENKSQVFENPIIE